MDMPTTVVDQKAVAWASRWRDEADTAADLIGELKVLRVEAAEQERQPITLGLLNAKLAGEPRKGMGADKLTTTDIKRLPCAAKQELVDWLNFCESHLCWPWQLGLTLISLFQKPIGERPVGQMCWLLRLWSLLRKDAITPWTASQAGHWDAAIAGNSSLREVLERMVLDETAEAATMHTYNGLLDIGKFYDSMSVTKTLAAARHLNFPLRDLFLSFLGYASARVLKTQNAVSEVVPATRSIIAGCRNANNFGRCLIYRLLEQTSHALPRVRHRSWVDDLSLRTEGKGPHLASETAGAIITVGLGLRDLGLDISPKSQLISNDSVGAQRVAKICKKAGFTITWVTEARDLGVDRNGGATKHMKTHFARFRAGLFSCRKAGRIFRGTRPTVAPKIARTGPFAKATYGTRVLGASPAQTRKLRKAMAAATGKQLAGRCLTTHLHLQYGEDPAVTTATQHMREWLSFWQKNPAASPVQNSY